MWRTSGKRHSGKPQRGFLSPEGMKFCLIGLKSSGLERNRGFLIASCGGDLEKVRAWGSSSCAEFEEHHVSGLPEGWVLFSGKNAQAPCPGIDVLAVSSSIRLLIRGGIKSGTGNAYLKFAPPYVVVDNSRGDEKVTV